MIEILAFAAPVATWSPISMVDLDLALLLVSLSVTYSLFVIAWEKARRLLLFERAPAMTPDVLAIWCFASAILLPPTLAAAVTGVSTIADWPSYNPTGTRPLYRYIYSTVAASVLAATAASWIFRYHHLALVGALPAAAAVWLAIGAGATTVAMCASGQFDAAKVMLHPQTHRLEVTTMVVAIGEYAVHTVFGSSLIWLSLPAAVVIQRYFTTAELRARQPDARLMDGEAWSIIADVIVEASETVSVLRIDAADRQTARTVAMLQGGCDAIGAYDDGGLAVLLLDCPPAQGDALARRLRTAMKLHKVECNIASASKPRDGQIADDLLAVCEAELVVAREASKRAVNNA
ncbi:MAG TPA: hypothetical protein VJ851_16585 [Jatrophihabitans sp.]|nr:hypothetical protein [Jatrophihabitans sp.]